MKYLKNFVLSSALISSALSFSAGHSDFLVQKRAEIEKKMQELHSLERGDTQRQNKEVYEVYLQQAALDLKIIKKEGILNGKEKYHIGRFLNFITTAQRRMARINFADLTNVSEKTLDGQLKLRKVDTKTKAMQKIVMYMSTKVNKQITFLINDMCKKAGKKPVDQGKIDRIVNTVSFFR
jgi:hypothetical protein